MGSLIIPEVPGNLGDVDMAGRGVGSVRSSLKTGVSPDTWDEVARDGTGWAW